MMLLSLHSKPLSIFSVKIFSNRTDRDKTKSFILCYIAFLVALSVTFHLFLNVVIFFF